MRDKTILKAVTTITILWIYVLVWCILELIFYGEITPRVVDDIILILFIPFIWNSVSVDIRK